MSAHSTGDGQRPRDPLPSASATQALRPLDQRERERLLEAIVEAEPECVKLLDAHGTLRMMNPAGLRMIDAERFEDVQGCCVYPLVADEHRAAFRALTEGAFRGDSGTLEFQIVGLRGTPRWLETHVVPFRNDCGDVVAALGITRDITDRTLAHAALRESERNFRMLFEQATEGIFVCDEELRFLDVNPAACQMTGYSREELLAMTVSELLEPHEQPRLPALVEQLAGGEVATSQWHARRRDGSTHIVEASSKRLPDGRYQTCVRDISERGRVETALRDSEDRLRRAVRAGRVGLWDWDLRTNKVYYSPEWKRQIGFDDHEIGDTLDEFQRRLHPDDMPGLLAETTAFIEQRLQEHETEFRLRHKDGSFRRILGHASLAFEADGTPIRMLGSHVDITERTELQAQLVQAQKMESIGRLAGGIAHDFNNLLTVINGIADVAIAGLHGGSPLRQDLEQIRDAGERAAAMTRQLLAMSRQQILQFEVVDLNAVIRDMRGMLQRLIGEDVALQLTLTEGLAPIRADPSQIEQIVLNLAVNARDAMPNGGTLAVETREVAAAAPAHRPSPTGPHVVLAVHDTGVGMDEAARKRVFEPFFTTKDVGKGTGLGLSTVYGIVKQSGGSVWVDSRSGAGTTFTIYFPRAEAGAAPRLPVPGAAALDGHETILVVEDEPAVRALTRRILESAGYRVVTASNGAEALQVLERTADVFQMMLTDVVMPGMNGRELAARVAPMRPDLKVLYTTGYTADALLRRGVLDATSRVVPKPFTARELRRKVRETLDSI